MEDAFLMRSFLVLSITDAMVICGRQAILSPQHPLRPKFWAKKIVWVGLFNRAAAFNWLIIIN